jgi:two-component system chemotaxis response regulator CheB
MASGSIVVIGGSTGALEALRPIVAALPGGLTASIFVVIHTAPDAPGLLDRILSRAGKLPVSYAVDRAPIEPGRIYVAPPDRHLLIEADCMRLGRGPRENRFRPAVDPLFRTASAAHVHVVGIILSGGQDDGAAGLAAVKKQGGIAIVQDPSDALANGMPNAALRNVTADFVLPAGDIGTVLSGLIGERQGRKDTKMTEHRKDVAEAGAHDIHRAEALGPPSPFTCPDCGGTLWQSAEGELIQFHCHVGHRFSAESLTGAQADALDQALWTALRALEESAELRRRMARHAHSRGMDRIGRDYEEQARESEERALTIRRVVMPESAQPAAG